MKSEKGCGIGAEFPHSHLLELLFIGFFASAWLLDMLVFQLYVKHDILLLNVFQITSFLSFLTIAVIIIKKSWLVVKPEVYDSERLIREGVYRYLRHPMYFGILLIYFSFVLLTLSFTLFMAWLIIFLGMNMMANYEEEKLVEIFGKDYENYRDQVSKWFPISI